MYPAPGPRTLAEVRAELACVDRELVTLLGVRLRLARSAIRLRLDVGEPLTDRAQERQVRARVKQWAADSGVPTELADRLFQEIIRHGKASTMRPVPTAGSSRVRSVRSIRTAPM
jgi:chorismate mutase